MTDDRLPRILVVDDEPFMRLTVRSILRAAGRFNLEDAADGDTALAKMDGFRPHMIICDVEMLPTGGIEFVEKLHGHVDPALRGTPVIMLTADRNEATIQTAVRLKLAGYLVKPVSSKQLIDLVRSVMKRQGLGDLSPPSGGTGGRRITPTAPRLPGQS